MILLFFISVAVAGCTSVGVKKPAQADAIITMRTDMHPEGISRSEYYQQMADGYVQSAQLAKAIEYYKLSLLHNPENVPSFLSLADVYMKTDKHLLALIAIEDAALLQPHSAEVLKRSGDLYIKTGLYSKAREVYQKMLSLNLKSEEAAWAVFYIYKLERKYTEALAHLSKMSLDEKLAGLIEYERALIYKLKRDRYLYSLHIQKAIKLAPRNREVLLEYARFSYERRSYEDAVQVLLNYTNTHHFDMEVSEHLAFAATQAENYKIAISEYDKQIAVSFNPSKIELRKAHCFYLMGDNVNAEKLYLKLALINNSDEARYYLGQIYYQQNKFQDATFILSQIPSYSDFYADAAVKLSLYYKYAGEDDKAINTLQEAFLKRADRIEVYKSYSDFLIEGKRYVEAVALIEKGIQLFPKDAELRLKMAYLHFRLNNQKSFKREIKAALQIDPENGDAYAMLSELWYLKERDVDETMYFVERATQLKSKNKNLKPILAWALMQKNRSAEAVALFEEFYEENPKESFFVRSLAQVYRRGGVKNKAQKLSELATRLEVDDSLKSRFIFREQTTPVNAEEFKENRTRLPASLEN